jgi:FAD/FMN-containing dehydrogenase
VLGIICEVSLKVLGAPRATATLEFQWDERRSLETLGQWNSRPLPIDASSWFEDRLRLRLSGTPAAVESGCAKLGGSMLDAGEAARWWSSLRDQTHDFFHPSAAELARGECLWRLSLPATAPPAEGCQLIEWNGAQRWWRSAAPPAALRELAAQAGGHATLVRASSKPVGAFAPLTPATLRVHQALKSAFDPDRIFNPGRLYADF